MELAGRILILILVSGIIAWVGDRAGQHFGKKKATIFGLRPRATSRLIAIITGILVMAASVAFVSLISHDFREAFLNLERIQEQNREATAEVQRITGELTRLRQQENKAREDLGRVRGDLEDAREENKALLTENASLIKENQRLDNTNEGLTKNNEELLGVIERAVAQIQSLRSERTQLEDRRNNLQKEIDKKVSQDPLFRAGHFVSRGVFALPSSIRTDRESLAAEFTKSLDIELAAFGSSEKAKGVEKIVPPGDREIEDAIDQLMLSLTVADAGVREIILDLVPRRSVWPGDPLELNIDIHLNFEVFPAGKVLALRQLPEEMVVDEGRLRRLIWDMYGEAAKVGEEQGILPSAENAFVAISNLTIEEHVNSLKQAGKPGVLSLVTRAPIRCNSILSSANLSLEFKPYQPEAP